MKVSHAPRKTGQKPRRPSPAGLRLLDRIEPSCAPGLPIARAWDELVEAIREHQVVIVTGETGSGKTTQLPKMCLAAGRGRKGKIVCTQPRRVAAMAVAGRLAEELGPLGQRLVGYRIRFRDRTGPETRIQFVTDGLLLAEVQRDPLLKAYDTIIVDEAHERSLNIDFLLGLVKSLLPRRRDLKVLITSATIDIERFSDTFDTAPVVEVSGRGYPIEICYRPPDELEEASPVDQVIAAVSEVRQNDPHGDILVFLPTERDIQDAVQELRALYAEDEALVLPMYGRLAARDQRRIFKPSRTQKIVVATNVAETSITVPGIRYVVDSGLARIARYNVRSRTKALPVAPISRASADQRAGRAGRLEAGICVRLYSEADYLSRPQYTAPEILRSNLAEVILRLAALNLGPVMDFPFVDPPSPQAIREGFTTLRELGALDPEGRLTKTSRLMARLPLDPRISRMILEARQENALREVSIIASALSIQDPKERPADKSTQADQAHARFRDSDSDFLSFLRLWEAYHREMEAGAGQGRMRRFCREHFVSFNRMREWRDIHDQILSILGEAGDFPLNDTPADYTRIHRAVLAGFLGHIGLHQEGSRYLAARGREVFLFPGSALYKKRPRWIVAAELVKTSQLFARTAAVIKPKWLEELAKGLTRSTYAEPHWEKRRGEVVAFERVTLFGLPIVEHRKVGYGRVNPDEAREIFIRQGLVPGEMRQKHPFLEHNRELIADIQELEDRTRRSDLLADEETLSRFYDRGLRELESTMQVKEKEKGKWRGKGLGQGPHRGGLICDERTLSKALLVHGEDECLRLKREDVLKALPEESELALFPGSLEVDGHLLPLTYRFAPGDPADGVTAGILPHLLPLLPEERFEWLVPGLLSEKLTHLLKGLPKQIRKELVPVPQTAEGLLKDLKPSAHSLLAALEKALHRRFGLRVHRAMWPKDGMPPHLLMRFEVVDGKGKVLGAGRDLSRLKKQLSATGEDLRKADPKWTRARAEWETTDLTLQNLPDLPSWVPLDLDDPEGPFRAFPGLAVEGEKVSLRLFPDPKEALHATRRGAPQLLARQLGREMRELKRLSVPGPAFLEACAPLGGRERVGEATFGLLARELLGQWDHVPTRMELVACADGLQGRLSYKAQPILQSVHEILQARLAAYHEIQRLRALTSERPGTATLLKRLEKELARLVPTDFPARATLKDLEHLGRYLKALIIRAERAYADPPRDAAKAKRLKPFIDRLHAASGSIAPEALPEASPALDRFRLLLEEYRVSLFAQEVGTAVPVSPKRLEEAWREVETFLPQTT